jgi:hypothetical protein
MHHVLLNPTKDCFFRSTNVHISIIGFLKLNFRIKIWTGASAGLQKSGGVFTVAGFGKAGE